jgi:uncharacterized protein YjiS (DUF1127 family)
MSRLTADSRLLDQLSPGVPLGMRLIRAAARALRALVVWQQRARSRHHLAAMDERLRRDIGVNNAHVYRELRKPFWIS